MYARKRTLAQRSSASHSPKNLFFWDCGQNKTIGFAHKDKLKFVSYEANDPSSTHSHPADLSLSNINSTVVQAKVVQVSGGLQILVIITESNVQFHDVRGTAVLHTYIGDSAAQPAQDESKHNYALPIARGITAIGDTAIVGSVDGSLLVFGVWSTSFEVRFEKKLPAHQVPISDLSADATRVVSADIDGNVFLWEGNKKEVTLRFSGFNGFPCTSLVLRGDLICAAYGSGHIRVFSVSKKRLLSEVAAHSHWINSLDIATSTGLVLSVSDDTSFRIWHLSEEFPWIAHKWSDRLTNTMLVGGCFLSPSGNLLAVSGYDCDQVHVFELSFD